MQPSTGAEAPPAESYALAGMQIENDQRTVRRGDEKMNEGFKEGKNHGVFRFGFLLRLLDFFITAFHSK